MIRKVLLLAGVVGVAIAAMGATSLGNMHALSKYATIGTCDALREGAMARQKGGASEGYTKICYCISDGAASPAYKWCSAQFTAAATTFVCTGGSATVCP